MRQHAFNWQYGQEDGFSEQAAQVYDAAGNLVSEVQAVFVASDPEMAPLSATAPESSAPKTQPGPIVRVSRWFMDANQDEDVTRGEMRVFGLGLLAGYIVKSILQ